MGRVTKKSLKTLIIIIVFSITITPINTLAGWEATVNNSWKYRAEQEEYVKDTWKQIDNAWYYFDSNGTMVTGWQFLNGYWYFCNPISDGRKGQMLSGWQWIDGKCYYFTPAAGDALQKPYGSMYVNQETPDGYKVSASGAWSDENGNEYFIQGQGIKTSTMTTTKKSSFGGGGGSSGGGGSRPTKPTEPEEPEEPEKPTKPEEPENPTAPEEPEKPTEPEKPEEPEKTIYFYRIQYIDIDSREILKEINGEGEKDLVINLEALNIDDYEICDDQPDQLVLTQNNLTEHIYYKAVNIATPSDAEMVNWQVHFTDAETHQIELGETRKGKIKEGGTLTVNYMDQMILEDGTIWKSLEPSPLELEVFGLGDLIYYVEYESDGKVPEEEDPLAQEKDKLKAWLQTAKEYEQLITDEDPAKIPDARFIVSNQTENNTRVRSIINHIDDTETYTFFVIGKNFIPNGVEITEWFGDDADYSNTMEEHIEIGKDTYNITRISITRTYNSSSCSHIWESIGGNAAGCLEKGTETYICQKCGEEVETFIPALGHIDENADTVCDRCGKRAFDQRIGSELKASISIEGTSRRELTFRCIDTDYQGGMLYISKEVIPVSDFGGYGNLIYNESKVRNYFQYGFQNAFSINGENLLPISRADSHEADYAMILSREETMKYQNLIPGGSAYLTRTLDGDGLAAVAEDGSFSVVHPDDSGYGIRPVIVLTKPDAGEAEKSHWNIGDIQAQELEGNIYFFECIDQNYSDAAENHKQTALFLCTSIIPANIGSTYEYEEQLDGTSKYVFHPGPIVNFGNSNDYKYSAVRKWIKKLEPDLFNVGNTSIGIDYAYVGKTEDGTYSQFQAEDLTPHYIGNQRMADKLFILSVDEALKYKDSLWRFEGAGEENPDTQYSAYSKGYWLRNPLGTSSANTGYVYIVDIVNGCIRPQETRPSGETGDDELNVTGTTGIRPAYTMPQE